MRETVKFEPLREYARDAPARDARVRARLTHIIKAKGRNYTNR